jgi:hypothetical protein
VRRFTAQLLATLKRSNLVIYAGRNGVSIVKQYVDAKQTSAPSTPMLYWTLDGWDANFVSKPVSDSKDKQRMTQPLSSLLS